ncbi:MAG: valine--tRNA ligase [Deltaproteobacteria bacterium]|nr:valine--tRNA ligase [Deltaproteobacteria bacterium]
MSEKNDDNILEKIYLPDEVEKKWSAFWIEEGFFTAEATSSRPPFSMVIPPPNITGTLHLGHALNNTLQDIIARYKRMKGFNVLWVPGIDHAGIATQNVVERKLHDEGTDRHTIGREKFIERVWKWRHESGDAIVHQLKRLGSSCDWTRQRFTMDEGLSTAVRKVFTELYSEGLIYRGDYIINWCPRCHTALSDLEVEPKEKKGNLWHLTYKSADGTSEITVATTRPETMLGDTAVAVNPNDERYKDLIGKTLTLPLTGRTIPVIADDEVDMEFGSGAVKITPAHDFNDFEMSKRHDLPQINIMDIDAKMNEAAGKDYSGLDRFEARKKVLTDLEAIGQLKEIEDYDVRIGTCYRCHTVVEPRLSKQWFVKVAPLAKPAIDAVKSGETKFVPKNWEKTYFEWMNNIRDWCISRQIWWGHRIPAWHCADCAEITVSTKDPSECKACNGKNITQDEDVLDTWFSSALWPFTTLNWPEDSEELKSFYPTSALFTSFDIIFFWVARMMMMGIKFIGKAPFKEVYIHALIRDAKGQKMSKSKGNVIDPLVIMDKYGTDALRFTLAVFAAQGRDIKLDEDRCEGYRNFTNKIWNLARFTFMNMEEDATTELPKEGLATTDKWILTKLSECAATVEESIEDYEFDRSARALYSFIWHELCDWYVELIKKDLYGDNGDERKTTAAAVLAYTLRETLKLLHPFMPFITEEIYSKLPSPKASLLKEEYPSNLKTFPLETATMESVMATVKAVRNIRTENDIAPKTEVETVCFVRDKDTKETLQAGTQYIATLAKVSKLTILTASKEEERPADAAFQLATVSTISGEDSQIEVFVPLKGLIDTEAEIAKIQKKLDALEDESVKINKKLSNEGFLKKAPPEVVEEQRARLKSIAEKQTTLNQGLVRMKELGD